MKLNWLHWALLFVMVIGGLFFWLTPYQYQHLGAVPIRTHRVTGTTEKLTDRGWIRMQRLPLEEKYPGLTDLIRAARNYGHSDEEIQQWIVRQEGRGREAGLSQEEIDKWLSKTTP